MFHGLRKLLFSIESHKAEASRSSCHFVEHDSSVFRCITFVPKSCIYQRSKLRTKGSMKDLCKGVRGEAYCLSVHDRSYARRSPPRMLCAPALDRSGHFHVEGHLCSWLLYHRLSYCFCLLQSVVYRITPLPGGMLHVYRHNPATVTIWPPSHI